MASTVTLSARAAFGCSGQYIARITGRDSKFTFAREFVGVKSGKRKETTTFETDEPGLYVVVDISKRGDKEETFDVIERQPDGSLEDCTCTREKAMHLARLLDDGDSFEVACLKVWPKVTATCQEPEVNPLAGFSDEQIRAEFARRGLSL